MKALEIRAVIESHGGGIGGRQAFVNSYLNSLLEGVKLPNGREVKKRPEDFSFRALWEGMVGDVADTLPRGLINLNGNQQYTAEAIDSTMFPIATGNIITRRVIDAYNMPGLVGDMLVETMQSNLRSETIPGFSEAQSPLEVKEGDDYKEASFGEKYVTTETSKKGRIISLTEENIIFDQTGQILIRARRIGERIALEREKTILDGVTGVNTNVYKPSGVATALYSAGHNNLNTSTGLVDWESIDTVKKNH